MPARQNPQHTIMVVDDDLATRAVIGALFLGAGFDVMPTRTSADSLATLATMRVDLVLVDPAGGAAVDPAQRWMALDALRQAAGTPVAMLTAHHAALFADFPAHDQAGPLAKPFDREELLMFVRRLLGLAPPP